MKKKTSGDGLFQTAILLRQYGCEVGRFRDGADFVSLATPRGIADVAEICDSFSGYAKLFYRETPLMVCAIGDSLGTLAIRDYKHRASLRAKLRCQNPCR